MGRWGIFLGGRDDVTSIRGLASWPFASATRLHHMARSEPPTGATHPTRLRSAPVLHAEPNVVALAPDRHPTVRRCCRGRDARDLTNATRRPLPPCWHVADFVKMRIRATARLSTWYAYPPVATRGRRGMAKGYSASAISSRKKTPDPFNPPQRNFGTSTVTSWKLAPPCGRIFSWPCPSPPQSIGHHTT